MDSVCIEDMLREPYVARQAMQNYFLPLIFTKEYDLVINETDRFSGYGEIGALMGSLKAQAYRERAQYMSNNDDSYRDYKAAISCLSEVYRSYGYRGHQSEEGWKLASHLARLMHNPVKRPLHDDLLSNFILFIDAHLFAIFSNTDKTSCSQCLEAVRLLNACGDNKNKKLLSKIFDYWNALSEDEDRKHSLNIPGTKSVKITKIPRGRKDSGIDRLSYLFAEDQAGAKYYIHRARVGISYDDWMRLKVGDILAVSVESAEARADDSGRRRALAAATAIIL